MEWRHLHHGHVTAEAPVHLREFKPDVTATENDQMFGSVTTGDIAEGLAAQGFKIDKRQAQLREPLKTIGDFPVTIKVFRDVTAEIKVTVEKET